VLGDQDPTKRVLNQRQLIDLVGNSITFSNRYLSALVSAIVFAIVFGGLVYFGYGNVSMSATSTPSSTAPAQK
jgi:hypothetical protein